MVCLTDLWADTYASGVKQIPARFLPSFDPVKVDVHHWPRGPRIAVPERLRAAMEWMNRGFYVDVGFGCNQRCIYCYQDHEINRVVPLDNLLKRAAFAMDRGYDHPMLIGGEPTIYPLLPELLDGLDRLGLKEKMFYTNGSRLVEASFVDMLVKHGLTMIQVSFDDDREDVAAKLTLNPKNAANVEQALTNLGHHAHLELFLYCVVNRLNHEHLVDHIRAVAAMAERTRTRPIMVYSGLKLLPSVPGRDELAIPHPVTAAAIGKAIDEGRRLGVEVLFRNIPVCALPGYEDRYSDRYTRVSTLISDSGEDDPMQSRFRQIPACAGCQEHEYCVGIERDYLGYYGQADVRPYLAPA
jgi:organic radical activating enzyme